MLRDILHEEVAWFSYFSYFSYFFLFFLTFPTFPIFPPFPTFSTFLTIPTFPTVCTFPFHRIGPLGQFGLVVVMSVCLYVCQSVCLYFFLLFIKKLQVMDLQWDRVLIAHLEHRRVLCDRLAFRTTFVDEAITWLDRSFLLFRKVWKDRQQYRHSWDRLAGPLPCLGLAKALGSRVMVSRYHTYSVPRLKNLLEPNWQILCSWDFFANSAAINKCIILYFNWPTL